MRGDKGQAAELLKKPIVFFDDHEAHALQVHNARQGNEAYVVRIGKKQEEPVHSHCFSVTTDPNEWLALCKNFHAKWQEEVAPKDAVCGEVC